MKTAFITDLDGTVIYSHRRTDGINMIQVESQLLYSTYMNRTLYNNLQKYNESIPFIPLTTRSITEYHRINFPIIPEYALVGNGAVLLHNDIKVQEWENETQRLIEPCRATLNRMYQEFSDWDSPYAIDRIRMVEDAFVFIKSNEAEQIELYINRKYGLADITTFRHGQKLSIVPHALDKSKAALRLKEYLGLDIVVSAGDTEMDSKMLKMADIVIPCDYLKRNGNYVDFVKENMNE